MNCSVDTNLEKSNVDLNTSKIKVIDKETGEEVMSFGGDSLTISSINETISLSEFSCTCSYCGDSFKIYEEHSCKETIGQRFIRLEKEIESLKLENKQLRKEMKWL